MQSNLTGKDLTCARKGARFARLMVSSVTDGRIANYSESKLHLEVNHLSPVDGDTRPPRRGLRLMKKRGIGGEAAG